MIVDRRGFVFIYRPFANEFPTLPDTMDRNNHEGRLGNTSSRFIEVEIIDIPMKVNVPLHRSPYCEGRKCSIATVGRHQG